jgi:hypothetical protein
MFRSMATAIASFGAIAGASLTGGCADLMQRSTIAPEWFQAKAVEVKGEGYPEIAAIPAMRPSTSGKAEWDKAAADLTAKAAQFDIYTPETIPTDEEVRARHAQLLEQLEGKRAAETGGQP